MGRQFQVYLNHTRTYCCKVCHAHLTPLEDCVSRAFRSAKGTAFLFSSCANVYVSDTQREETFTTGKHIVSDIFCAVCNYLLGWKYLFAYESSQKYKENKFILEAASITKCEAWRRATSDPNRRAAHRIGDLIFGRELDVEAEAEDEGIESDSGLPHSIATQQQHHAVAAFYNAVQQTLAQEEDEDEDEDEEASVASSAGENDDDR